MGERERLKQTGALPGIQTVLEWHGLEISKAIQISADIQRAGARGFFDGKVQQFVRNCESPAERQFLLGLFLMGADSDRLAITVSEHGSCLWIERARADETITFAVAAQVEVTDWAWECGECSADDDCPHESPVIARCDFHLFASCGGPPVELYIEIDGHEFHDRTKEQAARDRARDRSVLAQPNSEYVAILRFTAAEVFADPASIADEAVSIYCNRLRRILGDFDRAFARGAASRDDMPVAALPEGTQEEAQP